MQVPVDVLSQDDVRTLLSHPDRDDVLGLRDAALLSLMYHGAATAVELAGLNVADVQLRRRQALLRGEDGTRRRIPLAPAEVDLLQQYKERSRRLILAQSGSPDHDTDAFFLANKGQRIRVQDIRQILGTNVKASGLAGTVNLNSLRLSRAWHLREEGRSPESIQRFLGATSRSGRRVI